METLPRSMFDTDIEHWLAMMTTFQSFHRHKSGWKYDSYEELVLDQGQLWTDAEVEVQGPPKECFQNAWHMAWQYDLEYVEGYATSPGLFPVDHAWVVLRGKVIETTWPKPGVEYYGVPISLEFTIERMREVPYFSILGNDWRADCRLLRDGFPQ